MTTLSLEFPDEVLAGIGEEQARLLAREALLVRLHELGEVSSGRAAELLGISRRAFLDVLGRYNVSVFDPNTNLEDDLRNSQSAERG